MQKTEKCNSHSGIKAELSRNTKDIESIRKQTGEAFNEVNKKINNILIKIALITGIITGITNGITIAVILLNK